MVESGSSHITNLFFFPIFVAIYGLYPCGSVEVCFNTDTAVKAANLIGKGLYGVDLKMVDDKAYVIEINDNPSIDHGLEDAIIGDEMYYRLLNHFEQVLETKHY